MANCAFGWPLHSDIGPTYTPAITSGSFLAALPATNVQDRRLARVARTTDATTASTQMIFDLGAAKGVGVLAVLIPNITKSSTPTVRWQANTTNSFGSPAYDSGAIQVWPTGVTLDDVTGADGSPMHVWSTVVPPTVETYEWWKLAVVDTANADGHLDFARVIIAGKFQPTINLSVGAKTGHEVDTIRTVTPGGAALYDQRPARRTESFSVNDLDQTQAFANVRKMQRQLGISGQFFWVFDTADTTLAYERNYLAVLKQLTPLSYAPGSYLDSQYDVLEEL